MNFPMGRVSRFDTFLEDRAKPETEAVLYISTINPANLFPQSKHCAKRTIFKETVHWSCGPRQTEVACARDSESQCPGTPLEGWSGDKINRSSVCACARKSVAKVSATTKIRFLRLQPYGG